MAAHDLAYASAVELATLVRTGEVSPVEVARGMLDRIERLNPRLNAFCEWDAERTLDEARAAETARQRGASLGPLHGVPVSIKDLLAARGWHTTSGSLWINQPADPADAPSVARLRAAGAVMLGKTNTPEFGWKGVTENRRFGATRNPWNVDWTAGGSSGGASAAVAAGLGPIGLGTDGGGSLRIPASFCELVGFKPSFGRVPNFPANGVDSLRHTGPLTRTVADAALALDVLAGPDERDPHSLPAAEGNYLAQLDEGIKGCRIAYSPDLGYARVEPEIAALCELSAQHLGASGARVETVRLEWPDPYDCWTTFFYGGIAARLAKRWPTERDQLDPGLSEVVERGLKLSAVDLVDAQIARHDFWHRVRATFETFDLLITPALAVGPFPIGHNRPPRRDDPAGEALRWSPFTYPFNLTGQPAISVPAGRLRDGSPVGLQIVGRRFADATVLRAARVWERIQPWSQRRPPLDDLR